MAEEFLHSNIVIATKFNKPQAGELKIVHNALETIEKRLKTLTEKDWKIKLTIDDSELAKYSFKLQQIATGKATGPKPGGPAAPPPPPPPSQAPTLRVGTRPVGSAVSTSSGVKEVEGEITSSTLGAKFQQVLKGMVNTQTEMTDEVKKTVKLSETQLSIENQLKVAEDKRLETARIKAEMQRKQVKLGAELLAYAKSETRGPGNKDPLSKTADPKGNFQAIRAFEQNAVGRNSSSRSKELSDEEEFANKLNSISNSAYKEASKNRKAANDMYEQAGADAKQIGDKIVKNTEASAKDRISARKKANKDEQAEEEAFAAQMNALADKHFKSSAKARADAQKTYEKMGADSAKMAASASTKTEDSPELIADRKRRSKAEDAQRARNERREARSHVRETITGQDAATRQTGIRNLVGGLQDQGFVAGPSTGKFDALTGAMTEVHNLTRTTRTGWASYTVEVAKADEATGKMTITTLTGSAALRHMGDSIGRSIAKVAMWTVATTAVYGTIAALRAAAVAVVDLEEQMAFLARVSAAFAGGGASFEQRYESVKRLTEQILDLTQAYGGMAAESLEAAAVFGRAGKTEKEVLEGVKASLIAARIAELGLVESAKLLSSAMVQFNLDAKDLIPTLDSLNTLSNYYQVTTDDLLQSISRTGSVIEEHGGRLTELASITAVVAKTTSRTGAEIGNAIKTISSNLDRLDVQKSIMEQLGVSTVDLQGNSKSLSRIMLELRGSLEHLGSAQQKQLLIQIAGVRQANILIASLKGIDEAVVAENLALNDSASAQQEAKDRAFTLTAVLQRLQATFVKLSYQVGAPLVRLAANLLSIVDGLLRLVDVLGLFNEKLKGVTLPIATMTAVVYGLAHVLTLCNINIVAMITATTTWIGVQYAAVRASLATVASNTLAANSMAVRAGVVSAASFSYQAFGNVLAAAASPAALFAAAIVGVVLVVGNAVSANNAYNESLRNQEQQIQQNISAEEQHRQSIVNTVEAITFQIKRRDELKKQGKTEEAGRVSKTIERTAAGAGLGISSGNTVDDREIIQAGLNAQQESYKKSKELHEKAINERQQRIHKAQDKLKLESDKVGETEEINGKTYQLAPQNIHAFGHAAQFSGQYLMEWDSEKAMEKVQRNQLQKVKEAQAELDKLMKEQEADTEKIAAAEEKIVKSNADALALTEALVPLRKSMLGMAEYEMKIAEKEYKISLREGDAWASQLDLYKSITAETQRQYKEVDKIYNLTIKTGQSGEMYEHHMERAVKLLEQQLEARQKLDAMTSKSSQGSFTTMFGLREKMYGGVAKIAQARERGLSSTASSYGTGVADVDLERQQQLERIKANRAAEAAIAGSALSPAQKQGGLNAARLDTQDALNKLKELEIDKVLAILDAEKSIAVERKKSADEAARALGSLSEEDKLRVRAQAAYFNKNPGKTLSFEEQFSMSADSNKIAQQFFGGRLQDFSESKGKMAGVFAGAGLGDTRDLVRGDAELRAARRGRTDAELIRGGLGGAGRFEDMGRGLMGAAGGFMNFGGFAAGALGPAGGRGVDRGGKAKNEFEIGLREGTFDFSPLVTAFQEVIEADLQIAIDQMAASVNEIKRQIMSLRNRQIPKAAYGGP